jgi:hypothetical protein
MTEPSWSAAEDAQWQAALDERLASRTCLHCGSNKITNSMRGKPYMPYVDWHKAKSVELGWALLSLSGCTADGDDQCTECGKNPHAHVPPQ